MSEREEVPGMPSCSWCDGDGYTETWNDDQSDVVITLCEMCAATGVERAGFLPETL